MVNIYVKYIYNEALSNVLKTYWYTNITLIYLKKKYIYIEIKYDPPLYYTHIHTLTHTDTHTHKHTHTHIHTHTHTYIYI